MSKSAEPNADPPHDLLPALYTAWDRASSRAQTAHLASNKNLLLLLIVGAAVGAVPGATESVIPEHWRDSVRQGSSALAAGSLALSLWLTSVLRGAKKAETWYDGRALAESAKSMGWKYMMRAEPYGPAHSDADADRLFCDDLRHLLSDAGRETLWAGSDSADGEQITPKMRGLRALPIEGRLATYKSWRIAAQRAWYKARSAQHEQAASNWFRAVVIVNVAALGLSLLAIFSSAAGALVGVVTTCASAAIAWAQIHRYDELAHSYAFTSHEMGLLEPRAKTAASEDELARFVADCENAISREHTMWRARRETDS